MRALFMAPSPSNMIGVEPRYCREVPQCRGMYESYIVLFSYYVHKLALPKWLQYIIAIPQQANQLH